MFKCPLLHQYNVEMSYRRCGYTFSTISKCADATKLKSQQSFFFFLPSSIDS
jgi:hypothetical protein